MTAQRDAVSAGRDRHDPPSGPLWWALLVLGTAVVGFGVRGLLAEFDAEDLRRWMVWFAAGVAVHDLLVVPLTAALGRGLRHLLPARFLAPVQVGAILTGIVAITAIPVVGRFGAGAQAANPTLLTRPYETNLVLVLAIVWAAVGVACAVRSRRRGPPAENHRDG